MQPTIIEGVLGAGPEEPQNLNELYLGNNLIANVKETIKLQDLQRLFVLDISANTVSSGAANNLNYRVSLCHFKFDLS